MDYSFLKLHNTFNKAKADRMYDTEKYQYAGICLHPQEKYLQISNSNFDIVFNESYKVEIIDCAENVLKDVTDLIFIQERQDNDGIYKIAFELAPINEDFYYKDCYLKFTHLDSDLVAYSNSFLVTAEFENKSFRLDYKSYGNYRGTNYTLVDYYQSIRLIGYCTVPTGTEDAKVYTEYNGTIRKSRVIQSISYKFELDKINSRLYESLFTALGSDLVYINLEKAQTTNELSSSDRLGKSNVFGASFSAQINEDITYNDVYQIAPDLILSSFIPLDFYTLATIPSTGVATFNRNITFGSGTINLYNYDTDVLLNSLTITVTDNYFEFTMPLLANGAYYFKIENGLIFDDLNRTIAITDKELLKFEIADGQYNNTEYDNTQYLVN